jgi:glycerol-3-phosphate acyltransferase PlsX
MVPSVTLPACKAFLDKHPEAELVLVGTAEALALRGLAALHAGAATEVVAMDDPVEVALRRKRTRRCAWPSAQLKDGLRAARRADACVSAGNTGALMAVARYMLKTMEGIDRPAIATCCPTERDGFTTVLDLGANVDCTPEHLLQFAVMGSALVAAVDGKEEPTVGLLNIGEEAIKGSETIKRAGELLRAAAAAGQILNFHGNVEGNDIFKGTTTSWCATASSATWRSRPAKAWPACWATSSSQEFTRTR